MSAIETEVTALIAAILRADHERISGSALLTDDLAADSLDSVELIMAIEDRFAIDIPDEDAEEIRSVRELIQYVTLAVAINETAHDTIPGAPVSTRRH
jgi:acyl carrier protein